MQTRSCDVIGCDRPAAWQRVGNGKSRREEWLCHICRARQPQSKSQEIACYIPCQRGDASLSGAREETEGQEPGAAVITRGA